MKNLNANVDPEGLQEFSVVFTDRSLNHMSQKFQGVMNDISAQLRDVYKADHIALVPGGGTFAMEAVARQFGQDQNVMVIRNGWFSFRWTQIFEAMGQAEDVEVKKAMRTENGSVTPFAPAPIQEVTKAIKAEKPTVVFAPHVETSAGMILPDAYLKELADAAHSVNAIFVLDSIASGCIWVDMKEIGVDVLISAPQKGWSSTPCAGMVMMSNRAHARMEQTASDSFAMNLTTWTGIMAAYENGGHAYHATIPTDGLVMLRDTMLEMAKIGYNNLKAAQWELGEKTRAFLKSQSINSVAADGYQAPGVVVSYTDRPEFQNGSIFAANGAQIAAGVPLRCDEGDDFSTFRLGLFGLDKLADVDATVGRLEAIFESVG